jgi:hypothetical protein
VISAKEIAGCKFMSKNKEMQISCAGNRVPRTQDHHQRDQNRKNESTGNPGLAYTTKLERITIIHRIN